MQIEKGGASCINIMEYSKAARVKYLHESITTENQLASTFFDSALELIEIDKKSIPKMAPKKFLHTANQLVTLDLNSGKEHLKNLMKSGLQNTKNKYSLKDIESDITKLNTRSKEHRIKKRYLRQVEKQKITSDHSSVKNTKSLTQMRYTK